MFSFECSIAFLIILVTASFCQIGSIETKLFVLPLVIIFTFFKSLINSKFLIDFLTKSSSLVGSLLNSIVLDSNLDSLSIFCTKKFIFIISFLISLRKSSFVSISIFGLSIILSSIIKILVSGVFN